LEKVEGGYFGKNDNCGEYDQIIKDKKEYGDWNLCYGAYFLGDPFDKVINGLLDKMYPGQNLGVRKLPRGKKLGDYGVNILTVGFYIEKFGLDGLKIDPPFQLENGNTVDYAKMLRNDLVPYAFGVDTMSLRLPKQYKIQLTAGSRVQDFNSSAGATNQVEAQPPVAADDSSITLDDESQPSCVFCIFRAIP
jgi:hypothetical protein